MFLGLSRPVRTRWVGAGVIHTRRVFSSVRRVPPDVLDYPVSGQDPNKVFSSDIEL